MRAVLSRLEETPAWKLIIISSAVVATIGFGGAVARIVESQGGYELSRILGTASFVGLLVLYIRRRQYDSWSSGVQLAIIMLSAGWLAAIGLLLLAPSMFEGRSFFGPSIAVTIVVAPAAAGVCALMILIGRRFADTRRRLGQAPDEVRSNDQL